MTLKIRLSNPLTGCMITIAIGTASLLAIHPAMGALPAAENTPPATGLPLLMAQTTSLTGSWKLVNMTAGNLPTPMLPTVEQTAEFADGRIAGTGGCNRFMGSYETAAGQLKIGPLASTFMACQPDVMTQESTFLQALQGAQRYAIDQPGQLTVFYETEEGAGVLRFAAQTPSAPADQPTNAPADEPVRGLW